MSSTHFATAFLFIYASNAVKQSLGHRGIVEISTDGALLGDARQDIIHAQNRVARNSEASRTWLEDMGTKKGNRIQREENGSLVAHHVERPMLMEGHFYLAKAHTFELAETNGKYMQVASKGVVLGNSRQDAASKWKFHFLGQGESEHRYAIQSVSNQLFLSVKAADNGMLSLSKAHPLSRFLIEATGGGENIYTVQHVGSGNYLNVLDENYGSAFTLGSTRVKWRILEIASSPVKALAQAPLIEAVHAASPLAGRIALPVASDLVGKKGSFQNMHYQSKYLSATPQKGGHVLLGKETAWKITHAEDRDSFLIENLEANGQYLNLDEGDQNNGAGMVLWGAAGEINSWWRILQAIPGIYKIESVASPGKYLYSTPAAVGKMENKAMLWEEDLGKFPEHCVLWRFKELADDQVDERGHISLPLANDLDGKSGAFQNAHYHSKYLAATHEKAVLLGKQTGWKITKVGNNFLIETLEVKGQYLNLDEGNQNNGAGMILWGVAEETNSLWRIVQAGAGIYKIESVASPGKYLHGLSYSFGGKAELWEEGSVKVPDSILWRFIEM